jgi:hypothetical protein
MKNFCLLFAVPNQIELNTPRQTALFDYFCVFKKFGTVRFQNEPNMMQSGDKDDEFCSVELLTKIIKKFD